MLDDLTSKYEALLQQYEQNQDAILQKDEELKEVIKEREFFILLILPIVMKLLYMSFINVFFQVD